MLAKSLNIILLVKILFVLGNLMETHTVVPVEGHTWALAEVSQTSKLLSLFRYVCDFLKGKIS